MTGEISTGNHEKTLTCGNNWLPPTLRPASLSILNGTLGKKTPILEESIKPQKLRQFAVGPDTDRGYKPGTIARSMVQGAATRFVAKGQLTVIRPYRKNIMGGGEEKVRFDVVLKTSKYHIESCYAFATTALAAELHRQHGYRVRFNDNSNYPQILEIIEEVVLPKQS